MTDLTPEKRAELRAAAEAKRIATPAEVLSLLDALDAKDAKLSELTARLHQHEGKYDTSGLLKDQTDGD